MENNKETLTDVEKAKELFEYEMTAILLNLKDEFSSVSRDVSSEYLDMEIEEPKLEYAAPEIELKGIAYGGSGDVSAPAGGFTLGEAAVGVSAEVPDAPGEISIPQIAAPEVRVKTELPAGTAVRAEVFAAADRSVKAEDIKAAEVALPEAVSIPALPEVSEAVSVKAEIPEAGAFGGISGLPAAAAPEVRVSADVRIPEGVFSFSGTFQQVGIRPEIGEIPMPAGSMEVPEIKAGEVAVPKLPDSPAMPDHSAVLGDILEAVRSEI